MCCGLTIEDVYLIFENLVIFSEGEHLHREAFEVGRDSNSGIIHNRMKDGHIAVVMVFTADREKKKKVISALKSFEIQIQICAAHYVSTMMSQLGSDVLSS